MKEGCNLFFSQHITCFTGILECIILIGLDYGIVLCTPQYLLDMFGFFSRPWRFINFHEIVWRRVNIAQSHKHSYTYFLKTQINESMKRNHYSLISFLNSKMSQMCDFLNKHDRVTVTVKHVKHVKHVKPTQRTKQRGVNLQRWYIVKT